MAASLHPLLFPRLHFLCIRAGSTSLDFKMRWHHYANCSPPVPSPLFVCNRISHVKHRGTPWNKTGRLGPFQVAAERKTRGDGTRRSVVSRKKDSRFSSSVSAPPSRVLITIFLRSILIYLVYCPSFRRLKI